VTNPVKSVDEVVNLECPTCWNLMYRMLGEKSVLRFGQSSTASKGTVLRRRIWKFGDAEATEIGQSLKFPLKMFQADVGTRVSYIRVDPEWTVNLKEWGHAKCVLKSRNHPSDERQIVSSS
jgi:hypothetical protein